MPKRMVNIPATMSIQMPATQEHPAGRVVTLQPGWCELDDDMAAHPVLSKLMPMDENEAKRQEALAKAQREYNESTAEASLKLSKANMKANEEYLEAVNKQTEEYNERRDKAMDRGHAFNEPHPDPETRRAQALTASPQSHFVTAASMEQKPQAAEERQKTEDNLKSEAETNKEMKETSEREEKEGSGGHAARRVASDDDGDKGRARTRG